MSENKGGCKRDDAWSEFFNKYDVVNEVISNNVMCVSSCVLNRIRPARLMAKFDCRSDLPKSFVDNKLSILPVSRGKYVIGTFEIFCDLDDSGNNVSPTIVEAPKSFLHSIDCNDIRNEAMAINCAFVSGMLGRFTKEKELFPTVCGRMGASFEFMINSKRGPIAINVKRAQIEIDGGFESQESLYLIEAKIGMPDSFVIRQLYYPYRLWRSKIKSKSVRLIFLTYSNGIFHLREYGFDDENLYDSIKLLKYEQYSFRERCVDIKRVLDGLKIVEEPKLPFPQANSFERIITLCELLKHEGPFSKEDLATNCGFNDRQANYYLRAAMYLGLVSEERQPVRYTLSSRGSDIFDLPIVERQTELIALILSHKIFRKALCLHFRKKGILSSDVINIMKREKLRNVDSDETRARRASTVISWVKWILSLAK